MNKHDRDNLNFLLSADTVAIKNWITVISEDELSYAWELLSKYSQELDAQAEELNVEVQLELLDQQFTEANAVIKSIQENLK